MRAIIAGSRTIFDYPRIVAALLPYKDQITLVVSGHASGCDAMGEQWATENEKLIKLMPAEWDIYGKKAGPMRNAQMAAYADVLFAFWDGESRGTRSMINEMLCAGKETHVFPVTG